MTLVQMQPRPPRPAPARSRTAAAADTSGPQVCDDMTVEVALAVMAGARAGHLVVCDNDDQRTGLVTRAQLTTVRDSPAYTDRLRLRDISPCRGLSQNTAPTRARDPLEHASAMPGTPAAA
ncbi:hypothetical protein ACFV2S_27300 [Streptomyces sp. NPDC059695]|uniref:hypothetical protein n=1 Tax=Streptomyces sp. NPDC059695 TaxID=3346910 RepID=UPI0036B6B1FF